MEHHIQLESMSSHPYLSPRQVDRKSLVSFHHQVEEASSIGLQFSSQMFLDLL